MRLHQKYGPILRINPDEIHIADPDFLDKIYDARKRDKPGDPSLEIGASVAGTVGWELHRKRRQAMVGYFSPKAVKELEPLLAKKRDILMEMLEKNMTGENKVVNLSDLYFAYTWE